VAAVRNLGERLSEIRRCQRAHAKKRFEERFGLTMNRDRIYEIEKRISDGQVIKIECRPQVRNYFVAVEGKLIAVGYNTFTKRVVTALPDDYVTKLPSGLVHLARLKLLADESGVISDILSGNDCQLLYRQDEFVSYYALAYPGFSLKTGYDLRANQLVPFVKQPASARPAKSPAHLRFELLDLNPDICVQIKQKIQSGESRLVWSYSNTLKFHEVAIGSEILRAGYSNATKNLYRYEDPTEMD
jgi:hypothetical protein